jgi:hypothetical protein
MNENQIAPTAWQQRCLEIPEAWSIASLGGRAGGKTFGAALIAVRHISLYGQAAKVLVVRENYLGLQQISETIVGILEKAFPGRVNYNRQEHLVRIDGGAGGTCEFAQIDGPASISKMNGRECTLLIVDECGLLKEWRWVTMLKSNLRSPHNIPLRTVLIGNAGSYQHNLLYKEFIATRRPWHPFEVNGETFVTCPSTLDDNPHINKADYEKRLQAAYSSDPELLRAYLTNDWSISAGFYFGDVWDSSVHILPAVLPFEIHGGWWPRISMDHGVSAPNVALFAGEAPEALPGIARGSTVVFAESSDVDWADPGLNSSYGWPLGKIAEEIWEISREFKMRPQGVADDAASYSSEGDSLIETYRKEYGISFTKPASKGRVSSLALIKNLLANATARNGKPGLFISERCPYLISVLPIIMRDPRRRDDISSSGPDHPIDALRYHLLSPPRIMRIGINYHSDLVPYPGAPPIIWNSW